MSLALSLEVVELDLMQLQNAAHAWFHIRVKTPDQEFVVYKDCKQLKKMHSEVVQCFEKLRNTPRNTPRKWAIQDEDVPPFRLENDEELVKRPQDEAYYRMTMAHYLTSMKQRPDLLNTEPFLSFFHLSSDYEYAEIRENSPSRPGSQHHISQRENPSSPIVPQLPLGECYNTPPVPYSYPDNDEGYHENYPESHAYHDPYKKEPDFHDPRSHRGGSSGSSIPYHGSGYPGNNDSPYRNGTGHRSMSPFRPAPQKGSNQSIPFQGPQSHGPQSQEQIGQKIPSNNSLPYNQHGKPMSGTVGSTDFSSRPHSQMDAGCHHSSDKQKWYDELKKNVGNDMMKNPQKYGKRKSVDHNNFPSAPSSSSSRPTAKPISPFNTTRRRSDSDMPPHSATPHSFDDLRSYPDGPVGPMYNQTSGRGDGFATVGARPDSKYTQLSGRGNGFVSVGARPEQCGMEHNWQSKEREETPPKPSAEILLKMGLAQPRPSDQPSSREERNKKEKEDERRKDIGSKAQNTPGDVSQSKNRETKSHDTSNDLLNNKERIGQEIHHNELLDQPRQNGRLRDDGFLSAHPRYNGTEISRQNSFAQRQGGFHTAHPRANCPSDTYHQIGDKHGPSQQENYSATEYQQTNQRGVEPYPENRHTRNERGYDTESHLPHQNDTNDHLRATEYPSRRGQNELRSENSEGHGSRQYRDEMDESQVSFHNYGKSPEGQFSLASPDTIGTHKILSMSEPDRPEPIVQSYEPSHNESQHDSQFNGYSDGVPKNGSLEYSSSKNSFPSEGNKKNNILEKPPTYVSNIKDLPITYPSSHYQHEHDPYNVPMLPTPSISSHQPKMPVAESSQQPHYHYDPHDLPIIDPSREPYNHHCQEQSGRDSLPSTQQLRERDEPSDAYQHSWNPSYDSKTPPIPPSLGPLPTNTGPPGTMLYGQESPDRNYRVEDEGRYPGRILPIPDNIPGAPRVEDIQKNKRNQMDSLPLGPATPIPESYQPLEDIGGTGQNNNSRYPNTPPTGMFLSGTTGHLDYTAYDRNDESIDPLLLAPMIPRPRMTLPTTGEERQQAERRFSSKTSAQEGLRETQINDVTVLLQPNSPPAKTFNLDQGTQGSLQRHTGHPQLPHAFAGMSAPSPTSTLLGNGQFPNMSPPGIFAPIPGPALGGGFRSRLSTGSDSQPNGSPISFSSQQGMPPSTGPRSSNDDGPQGSLSSVNSQYNGGLMIDGILGSPSSVNSQYNGVQGGLMIDGIQGSPSSTNSQYKGIPGKLMIDGIQANPSSQTQRVSKPPFGGLVLENVAAHGALFEGKSRSYVAPPISNFSFPNSSPPRSNPDLSTNRYSNASPPYQQYNVPTGTARNRFFMDISPIASPPPATLNFQKSPQMENRTIPLQAQASNGQLPSGTNFTIGPYPYSSNNMENNNMINNSPALKNNLGSNIHVQGRYSVGAPPPENSNGVIRRNSAGASYMGKSNGNTIIQTSMMSAQSQKEIGTYSMLSSANSSSLQSRKLCIICMAASHEVALDPCGHICMCNGCAMKMDQCPICRRNIEKFLRIFHS